MDPAGNEVREARLRPLQGNPAAIPARFTAGSVPVGLLPRRNDQPELRCGVHSSPPHVDGRQPRFFAQVVVLRGIELSERHQKGVATMVKKKYSLPSLLIGLAANLRPGTCCDRR